MDFEKNEIINKLEHALTIDIEKVFFAESKPLINAPSFQSLPVSRFIMPLTGKKHIAFASNNEIINTNIIPGDILYIPPDNWTLPFRDQSHTMLGVVFLKQQIRVIYVNIKAEERLTIKPKPQYAFHFNYPPDNMAFSLIHLLNKSAETKTPSAELNNQLLKSVLIYITDSLKALHNNTIVSKSFATWSRISLYIEDHFMHDINRDIVAEHFQIHPNYLSHLFHKHAKRSFNEYLNELKLARSCYLLKNTNATLDEISEHCAFNNTSYFIRVFKKAFNLTPSQYRNTVTNKSTSEVSP